MTKAEYDALYRAAGRNLPNLTLSSLQRLKKVYIKVGNDVAAKIAQAKLKGLSDLTTESWARIDIQLHVSIQDIQNAIDARIKATVLSGERSFRGINIDYLNDVIDDFGNLVTKTGISNMFSTLNTRVVESVVNRIFADGYTYSDRIWRAGLQFERDVKNIVSAGLAQGRDVVKIARDLTRYVKKGKKGLIRVDAYGELKRGTKQFIRRIGNQVDYRALRLIRSELYASMQDAAKLSGQMNPACTGLYDWVRSNSKDWGCDCPSNAANSPYTYENVPGYDHPNCLCRIVPRLRNHGDFVSDLRRWSSGEKVEYLDTWYNDQYLPLSA